MRILFVVNALVYGGAETQLIALAAELSRRGNDVVIHTLQADNPRLGELARTGVRVVEGAKRLKFDLSLVARIRRFTREFKPDIVQGFLVDGNLHARLAVLGTRTPALNSERSDNYAWPLRHRIAVALTRRSATAVVANSHPGARLAQRYLGLPDDRVHVVWNGIDVGRITEQAGGERNVAREFFGSTAVKVACLVGMIRPEKDHLLALQVAEALFELDPSWRVLLVGDSTPQTRAYKNHVLHAARGLEERGLVAFAGLRRDVPAIIRSSTVLFSTSKREGFPNVVLEAMALGTPVVSTEYSDIRMILPDDWQVVRGRDARHLAAAIVRADVERDGVSVRQREWLERNATIQMAAERLEAIYLRYASAAAPSLATQASLT